MPEGAPRRGPANLTTHNATAAWQAAFVTIITVRMPSDDVHRATL